MGYRGVVKPGRPANSIVMKALNAQRGAYFADSDFHRSEQYFVGMPTALRSNLSLR
jgi:hypothetical protein